MSTALGCRLRNLVAREGDRLTYLDEGDSADWTKQSLDLFVSDAVDGMRRVRNCDDVLEYLRMNGMTVEDFKRLPAYRLALRRQPWLREL